MKRPKDRPNFFAILGLDADAEDWPAIEERIGEKQRKWSKDLNTGVPKLARPAQENLQLLPEIRRVMQDPEARAAEAAAYLELLDHERQERSDALDAVIEVLRASGTVTPERVQELVGKFGEHFDRAEIAERLRRQGVKIEKARAKRRREKAKRLDPGRHRSIRADLDVMKKSDLYDFLDLPRGSSPEALRDEANARLAHLRKVGRTDAEATASKSLCGTAATLFKSDEGKERYDNSLARESLERLDDAIAEAGHDRIIRPQEMDALIHRARAMGVDAALAREHVEERAEERGWAIQSEEETEAERVRVCGACDTVARTEEQEKCHECGEPLTIPCPRCGSPTPTQDAACTVCGARTGDASLVRQLMEEGRHLASQGRAAEAVERFDRVLRYWPGWEEAETAKSDVERRVREREEALAELDRAIAGRRLFEARAKAARFRRRGGLGGGRFESRRRKIEAGIARAEKAFSGAREKLTRGEENRAVELLEKALATASDYERAKEALAALPPPAPPRLEVEPQGGSFRLSWFHVRSPGTVRYRVLRKAGGAPAGPSDGEVVAEVAGTSFDDVSAGSGVPWHYAVYSVRGGVCSDTAASDGPWFRIGEVDELRVTPGPGQVALRWRPPDGCREVRVARARGAPPPDLDAGTRVEASREGAHDHGLTNGVEYGYLVAAVFDDPERPGRELISSGLRRTARPTAPPPAVEGLRCRRSGGSLAISWSPVSTGSVQIRVSPRRPDLPAGGWTGLDQLDRLGEEADVVGPGSARVEVNRQGRWFLVPVTVERGIAVVGEPLAVTTIDDVSDLQSRSAGRHIVLTWTWPPGIDEVVVAYSYDREPAGPSDRAATRRRLTRREYDRSGCFELRNAERKPHYFKVFSKAPDVAAYGAGTSVFESRGRNRTVRFRVEVDRFLGALGIGPARGAALRLESKEVDRLHDLLLVVKKGYPPRSPEDGTVIKEVDVLDFEEGTASIPIPPSALGRRRYAKLFFAAGPRQADVRLLPANKDRLELG